MTIGRPCKKSLMGFAWTHRGSIRPTTFWSSRKAVGCELYLVSCWSSRRLQGLWSLHHRSPSEGLWGVARHLLNQPKYYRLWKELKIFCHLGLKIQGWKIDDLWDSSNSVAVGCTEVWLGIGNSSWEARDWGAFWKAHTFKNYLTNVFLSIEWMGTWWACA